MVRLGHDARSIVRDLGDWIPDVGQIRDVLQARVCKVAARDLRAAFEKMARHGSAGKPVPLVPAPSEVRHGRPQHERRVRHSPRNDDLCTGLQCLGDLEGTLIHVCADECARRVLWGEMQSQERIAALIGEIVALQHRDARLGQAELRGQPHDMSSGASRIRRTEVADDGDPVPEAVRKDRTQFLLKQRLITGLGVGAPCELGEREGPLSQVLEHERRRTA